MSLLHPIRSCSLPHRTSSRHQCAWWCPATQIAIASSKASSIISPNNSKRWWRIIPRPSKSHRVANNSRMTRVKNHRGSSSNPSAATVPRHRDSNRKSFQRKILLPQSISSNSEPISKHYQNGHPCPIQMTSIRAQRYLSHQQGNRDSKSKISSEEATTDSDHAVTTSVLNNKCKHMI